MKVMVIYLFMSSVNHNNSSKKSVIAEIETMNKLYGSLVDIEKNKGDILVWQTYHKCTGVIK